MAEITFSSGSLDRVVVLQRLVPNAGRDDLGGPVEVWVDLAAPMWAQKIEGAGGEADRGAENAAVAEAQFVIRYMAFSPPLNPRDRLLFNPDPAGAPEAGSAFNIRRVSELGRRVGWLIDASARADQG